MGSTVVLKNRPEDGNYTLTLRVHAHDADGRSAWGAVELDFDGDLLMFGNNYYPMALKCLMHFKYQRTKHKRRPKKIPHGGDPGPYKVKKKKIAALVNEIAYEDPRRAKELQRLFGHIPGVRLGHGLRPSKKAGSKTKAAGLKRKAVKRTAGSKKKQAVKAGGF